MHEAAIKWDKERGYDNRFGGNGNKTPKEVIPENRPCDWCGKIVDKGFIHEECSKKETELYMDILY